MKQKKSSWKKKATVYSSVVQEQIKNTIQLPITTQREIRQIIKALFTDNGTPR